MRLQKVNFKNAEGQSLVGRLELPADRHPHNFAVFAHCFTCNKNATAAKNITKALSSNGFGVLRFDFTGLGDSSGEFSETDFSGNVEDLVAASDFLAKNYKAPTLLVGHSLGGAAIIFAAGKIESVRALATIAAPSDPAHVQQLLKSDLKEIIAKGKATVHLGERDFTIKKQFLDDLNRHSLPEAAARLRKPLLILHSPQDKTVGIKNAEDIYLSARHPKSFVSLDGADHLLTDKKDSIYAGKVISSWAQRYLELPEGPLLQTDQQVVASLDAQDGFTTSMKLGKHYLTADEPMEVGGNDFGPSPYELVSAALSACTAMTVQMYAKRKGWPLENIEVHTSYGKSYAIDCEACESTEAKIDTFQRTIKLTGALDAGQIKRVLEIADKCPVHRTLHSETQIITKLID
jgi:putative redox protein